MGKVHSNKLNEVTSNIKHGTEYVKVILANKSDFLF